MSMKKNWLEIFVLGSKNIFDRMKK